MCRGIVEQMSDFYEIDQHHFDVISNIDNVFCRGYLTLGMF